MNGTRQIAARRRRQGLQMKYGIAEFSDSARAADRPHEQRHPNRREYQPYQPRIFAPVNKLFDMGNERQARNNIPGEREDP
jgi:hypothetical protein